MSQEKTFVKEDMDDYNKCLRTDKCHKYDSTCAQPLEEVLIPNLEGKNSSINNKKKPILPLYNGVQISKADSKEIHPVTNQPEIKTSRNIFRLARKRLQKFARRLFNFKRKPSKLDKGFNHKKCEESYSSIDKNLTIRKPCAQANYGKHDSTGLSQSCPGTYKNDSKIVCNQNSSEKYEYGEKIYCSDDNFLCINSCTEDRSSSKCLTDDFQVSRTTSQDTQHKESSRYSKINNDLMSNLSSENYNHTERFSKSKKIYPICGISMIQNALYKKHNFFTNEININEPSHENCKITDIAFKTDDNRIITLPSQINSIRKKPSSTSITLNCNETTSQRSQCTDSESSEADHKVTRSLTKIYKSDGIVSSLVDCVATDSKYLPYVESLRLTNIDPSSKHKSVKQEKLLSSSKYSAPLEDGEPCPVFDVLVENENNDKSYFKSEDSACKFSILPRFNREFNVLTSQTSEKFSLEDIKYLPPSEQNLDFNFSNESQKMFVKEDLDDYNKRLRTDKCHKYDSTCAQPLEEVRIPHLEDENSSINNKKKPILPLYNKVQISKADSKEIHPVTNQPEIKTSRNIFRLARKKLQEFSRRLFNCKRKPSKLDKGFNHKKCEESYSSIDKNFIIRKPCLQANYGKHDSTGLSQFCPGTYKNDSKIVCNQNSSEKYEFGEKNYCSDDNVLCINSSTENRSSSKCLTDDFQVSRTASQDTQHKESSSYSKINNDLMSNLSSENYKHTEKFSKSKKIYPICGISMIQNASYKKHNFFTNEININEPSDENCKINDIAFKTDDNRIITLPSQINSIRKKPSSTSITLNCNETTSQRSQCTDSESSEADHKVTRSLTKIYKSDGIVSSLVDCVATDSKDLPYVESLRLTNIDPSSKHKSVKQEKLLSSSKYSAPLEDGEPCPVFDVLLENEKNDKSYFQSEDSACKLNILPGFNREFNVLTSQTSEKCSMEDVKYLPPSEHNWDFNFSNESQKMFVKEDLDDYNKRLRTDKCHKCDSTCAQPLDEVPIPHLEDENSSINNKMKLILPLYNGVQISKADSKEIHPVTNQPEIKTSRNIFRLARKRLQKFSRRLFNCKRKPSKLGKGFNHKNFEESYSSIDKNLTNRKSCPQDNYGKHDSSGLSQFCPGTYKHDSKIVCNQNSFEKYEYDEKTCDSDDNVLCINSSTENKSSSKCLTNDFQVSRTTSQDTQHKESSSYSKINNDLMSNLSSENYKHTGKFSKSKKIYPICGISMIQNAAYKKHNFFTNEININEPSHENCKITDITIKTDDNRIITPSWNNSTQTKPSSTSSAINCNETTSERSQCKDSKSSEADHKVTRSLSKIDKSDGIVSTLVDCVATYSQDLPYVESLRLTNRDPSSKQKSVKQEKLLYSSKYSGALEDGEPYPVFDVLEEYEKNDKSYFQSEDSVCKFNILPGFNREFNGLTSQTSEKCSMEDIKYLPPSEHNWDFNFSNDSKNTFVKEDLDDYNKRKCKINDITIKTDDNRIITPSVQSNSSRTKPSNTSIALNCNESTSERSQCKDSECSEADDKKSLGLFPKLINLTALFQLLLILLLLIPTTSLELF